MDGAPSSARSAHSRPVLMLKSIRLKIEARKERIESKLEQMRERGRNLKGELKDKWKDKLERPKAMLGRLKSKIQETAHDAKRQVRRAASSITRKYRSSDGETFYCAICMEEHDNDKRFTLSNCGHAAFCRDGLSEYVRSKIRDGCPFPTCFYSRHLHDAPSASIDRQYESDNNGGGGASSGADTDGDDSASVRSGSSRATLSDLRSAWRQRAHRLRAHLRVKECKALISEADIRELLSSSAAASTSSGSSTLGMSASLHLTAENASAPEPSPSAAGIGLGLFDGETMISLNNKSANGSSSITSSAARPRHGSSSEMRLYDRLLAAISRPHERCCPSCDHPQEGSIKAPSMTCEACGAQYCYAHANAHTPSVSCEEYERSQASVWAADQALVAKTCRACPGCSSPIEKNDGCNTLRCVRCGTAFCWLCCRALTDAEIDDHYAVWNVLGGCPLKQLSGTTPGPFSDSISRNLTYGSLLLVLLPILLFAAAALWLRVLLSEEIQVHKAAALDERKLETLARANEDITGSSSGIVAELKEVDSSLQSNVSREGRCSSEGEPESSADPTSLSMAPTIASPSLPSHQPPSHFDA